MSRATGRDVLCLSSIDWADNWQVHQQLATTLAARGDRVLFVENTGVRPPTLADAPRLRRRLANWARGPRSPAATSDERLRVYAPLLLPLPYSRVATQINRAVMRARIARWRRGHEASELVLWTFLPTPLANALIRDLRPRVTIYHCVDDLPSTSPAARRVARSEIDLLRSADLVFVTSQGLRTRALRYRTQAALLPSAVDIDAFDRVRDDPAAVPTDLGRVRRPVVGYIGEVKRWVDQDLLRAVAGRLPGVNFVLVGPVRTPVGTLTGLPNVHLLGARPHAQIPGYLRGFDVALIPYRVTPYTRHVHPAKLHEYLAMGLPIVSTPLPEIARLNADHDDVAMVATDADAFCGAIERALAHPDPAAAARRVALARANGWTARFAAMSDLLAGALAAKAGITAATPVAGPAAGAPVTPPGPCGTARV